MRTVKNTDKNRESLLKKGYEERSGSTAYETPFITVIDSEKIFYKDRIIVAKDASKSEVSANG